MLDPLPVSNFNSLLELFVVLNLTYISVSGVNDFINCKVFGLNNFRNLLESKIEIKKRDIELLLKMKFDEEKRSVFILAKKGLKSLLDVTKTELANIQTNFRGIYLLGVLFTLFLLFLGGLEDNDGVIIIIKWLSVFSLLGIITLSILGFVNRMPKNTIFLVSYLFIGFFILSLTIGLFLVKWLNFFPIVFSIIIPLTPFLFNYLGTLIVFHKLTKSYSRIKTLVSEPSGQSFVNGLNFLIRQEKSRMKFSIFEARYGSKDSYIDVTEVCVGLICDNKLEISCKFNEIFGDPAPNEKKILTIKYCLKNRTFSNQYNEDTEINLP